MQRKKVIFLSGKMSGLPDFGRAHFAEAEAKMKARGYIVLNPATLPIGMEDNKYMPICIAMLDAADEVLMLEGWDKSKGARVEFAYAIRQDKAVIFESIEKAEL